jgi:hypothetical protein
MLIGHQKWACEACNRGHRVTSCNHHDRPLIRIKRKGRPFATCSICNATPCETPTEHVRLKREAELESPSSKVMQLNKTSQPAVSTTGWQTFDKLKKRCRRYDADVSFRFLEINPRQTIPAPSQLQALPPHRASTLGQ